MIVEEQLEQVRAKGSGNKEVRSAQLSQARAEQQYAAKKCMNVIDKIIRNKTNFFQVTVVENIFITWKHFIEDRKKATARIAELMDKNAQ